MTVEFGWLIEDAPPSTPADPGTLDAQMVDRLLQVVRPGPVASNTVALFAKRTAALLALSQQIVEAFGLDDAVGIQLDRIGEIVQRPRFGASDERYRTLLKIQVNLVLSSMGSAPTLLQIVRIFTGHEPSYSEHHPARFSVTAQVPAGDTTLLVSLLRAAKAGGVAMTVATHPEDAVLLGDVLGDAVDDPGVGDVLPPDGPVGEAYVTAVIVES